MDAALDEGYSHHEDHEGHEGSDIFVYKLRALRVLRGKSFLVAASPRQVFCSVAQP